MRLSCSLLIGCILIAMPAVASAAPQPLFSRIFAESKQALPKVYPDGRMKDYIIDEMERWNGDGVRLVADDIADAVDGDLIALCNNKKDAAGVPIEFAIGSDASIAGSCMGLQRSILSLLRQEQEADQLGKDLVSIANGSELSIADEGDRPVNMARLALLLRRVWSGTGAGVLPWDTAAQPELDAVDTALASADELDLVILRFRHGYFRDKREKDQTFNGIGDDVGAALLALATKLHISGNETLVGEFTVPGLTSSPEIAVWARKDDIGITWVYPTRFAYPRIKRGGTYPALLANRKNVAYPFSYDGTSPDASTYSPLCNRTVARNGYLCRPLPADAPACDAPADPARITLLKCDIKNTESVSGPFVCEGLKNLFLDDGTPLADPTDPGRLNPALKPADTRKICEPGTKVIYQDEITAHACYVGACLLQSMSGHTLVPNRNPTLVNEATSPYLACVRPDPQLGLYAEVAQESPYPLPPYIGHQLVQDFEQEYCMQNGKPTNPVLGFCQYREAGRTRAAGTDQLSYYNNLLGEGQAVALRQKSFLSIATVIGQRAAGEQAHEVERKVFGSLATLVQQTADLLLELKRAPLTQSACPWTGPVQSSSSST